MAVLYSMGEVNVPGNQVVTAARSWIGTPYRHQASARGIGADCLGLVLGVWRGLGGMPPAVEPYSADWRVADQQEVLWRKVAETLEDSDGGAAGDVLLLRMMRGGPAKHLVILANPELPTVIHAYSGREVSESSFTPAWRSRVVASFRLPI
ncbi:MAG: peptidase [Pikeienuella sp.]